MWNKIKNFFEFISDCIRYIVQSFKIIKEYDKPIEEKITISQEPIMTLQEYLNEALTNAEKKNNEIEINGVIYTPLDSCALDEEHCFNCKHVNKINDNEWFCGLDSSYHNPRNCPFVIRNIDYFL